MRGGGREIRARDPKQTEPQSGKTMATQPHAPSRLTCPFSRLGNLLGIANDERVLILLVHDVTCVGHLCNAEGGREMQVSVQCFL